MNLKRISCLLALEAAICIVLCVLQIHVSGLFSAAAAFPLEQIGWGLRRLSLSGPAGNILAVLLYILISLVPFIIWLVLIKKQRMQPIDVLLPCISVLLLAVLYFMVNPGLFHTGVSGTGKWMLGSAFYSVLMGYLVIRILKTCTAGGQKGLLRGLHLVLIVLNMVFIFYIFWQRLGTLLLDVQAALENSTFMEADVDLIFLLLRYGADVLPFLLDIGVVFLSGELLNALAKDRYSDHAAAAADHLARFCTGALIASVASQAALNILQLLFCERLSQTNMEISLPVCSLLFVLAVLLFAAFIREDQKLKQENDLFI